MAGPPVSYAPVKPRRTIEIDSLAERAVKKGRGHVMERVLIVDPDAVRAAELQETLEGVGYEATVCSDERNVCETIRENCPDLVVVVPRSPVSLGDTLAVARSAMDHLELPPELLFLLRWTCRGPAERLLADRWNAQVLYER